MIPATEWTLSKEAVEETIHDEISVEKSSILASIRDLIDHMSGEKTKITSLVTDLLDGLDFSSIDFSAQSVVLLDFILIFLFLFLTFQGIPNFIATIASVITSLGTNISLLLRNIVMILFDLSVFIGESTVTVLLGIGQVIIKLIEVVGVSVFSLVVGIITVIGFLVSGALFGVVKVGELIWNVLDVFLGLILDILRLIYEAIFQPGLINTS